jgi:hypothetical protein
VGGKIIILDAGSRNQAARCCFGRSGDKGRSAQCGTVLFYAQPIGILIHGFPSYGPATDARKNNRINIFGI